METIFINLGDYTEEPLSENNVDLVIRNALSRCGYHVFKSEINVDNTDPLQSQINELINNLTCFMNVNARVNIKTLPTRSALLTFLP